MIKSLFANILSPRRKKERKRILSELTRLADEMFNSDMDIDDAEMVLNAYYSYANVVVCSKGQVNYSPEDQLKMSVMRAAVNVAFTVLDREYSEYMLLKSKYISLGGSLGDDPLSQNYGYIIERIEKYRKGIEFELLNNKTNK